MGVKHPPIFETIKMKKIGICEMYNRSLLILKTGLMRSIDAPVVPKIFAITPPINKNNVLFFGVPKISPDKNIPPLTINSEPSKTIKEKYSPTSWSRG